MGRHDIGAWYVARTNIKCERKAQRNIEEAGYEVYSPIRRYERFDRRKRIFIRREEQLIVRYLFVKVDTARDETPWAILRACEGVEEILHHEGTPIQLGIQDVKILHAMMEAERNFAFDETRDGKLHRKEIGRTKRETARMIFKPGKRVRITDGPFTDFEGLIHAATTRGTIEVMTSLFGRQTHVELDPEQVEIISDKAA